MVWISSLRVRNSKGARALVAVAVFCVACMWAHVAFGATFNPEKVISDDNMRAHDSMTQSDVQAFLDAQSGSLKSLVTTDYEGKTRKPAAQIISEASKRWGISPKVLLVTLQKEQSLLTQTATAGRLEKAMGAGCPESGGNRYPGFGNQVWNAARLLDGYGEGKNNSTIALWKSPYTVYGGVKTRNVATYKLYVYTPHVGASAPYGDLAAQSSKLSGNAMFWWLYRKYFGDTFADPAKRTVYRFRDKKRGGFFYTASQSERYRTLRNTKRYKYEAVAFSWNTSTTVNPVAMYRFYNRKTGDYLYTTSRSKRDSLRRKANAKKWRYDGIAFRVSKAKPGALPVYLFKNKKTGLSFFSTSKADKSKYSSKAYRKKRWRYQGIGFYIAR